ncbi:MAG: hypothetical protein IKU13_08985 [Clostridia bacterium]|nr:hypothetical protein [Clostridia bacterium]
MTDFTMDYYLTSRTTETEGMSMESYGIKLVQTYNDGRVLTLSIPDITVHKSLIEMLMTMMEKGFVTIMTAREIVEDFLEI